MIGSMTKSEMATRRIEAAAEFKEALAEFIANDKTGRGKILDSMPENYKRTFLKAYEGKSKTTAIKAKCLDCCCFVMKEIELCSTTSCALWDYRPYKPSESKK